MTVQTEASLSLLLGGILPQLFRALKIWMPFSFRRVPGLFADKASKV